MTTFQQRFLTTIVLLPSVLLAIYYAPSWLLAGILLALVALSSWEWMKLIPLQRLEGKLLYLLALLGCIGISSHWATYCLCISLAAWVFILYAVICYPASQQYWGYATVVGAAGLLFLSVFCSVFVGLYQSDQGQHVIVYVLFLIWATDIGAYLVGKQWGTHKMIPQVSPGKTIEGTMGGILAGMVVAGVGYAVFQPQSAWLWFLVALMTVLIAVLGDLSMSMLKRRSHVKDSGQVLPGHGGILDRLDSAFAALPLFYFALSFLGVLR